MNLIGQTIKHKAFGSGVVTNISDGIISICFQNDEKRFIYPDAFRNFLVLKDENTQQQVKKQIELLDKESQKIREAEQVERKRKHKLLNFEIMENSHVVFHIPCNQIEQVFRTGQVSTGAYLGGYSKGMPRIAGRVKPNSACLFTALPKGQPENKRHIIGVFMVAEDYFGADAHDGIIQGHPQYRLLIPKENQLLFWDYFGQDAPPRWGGIAFKYCSGDIVNRILADLVERPESSEQKESAMNFYLYFCKTNHLRPLIKIEEK